MRIVLITFSLSIALISLLLLFNGANEPQTLVLTTSQGLDRLTRGEPSDLPDAAPAQHILQPIDNNRFSLPFAQQLEPATIVNWCGDWLLFRYSEANNGFEDGFQFLNFATGETIVIGSDRYTSVNRVLHVSDSLQTVFTPHYVIDTCTATISQPVQTMVDNTISPLDTAEDSFFHGERMFSAFNVSTHSALYMIDADGAHLLVEEESYDPNLFSVVATDAHLIYRRFDPVTTEPSIRRVAIDLREEQAFQPHPDAELLTLMHDALLFIVEHTDETVSYYFQPIDAPLNTSAIWTGRVRQRAGGYINHFTEQSLRVAGTPYQTPFAFWVTERGDLLKLDAATGTLTTIKTGVQFMEYVSDYDWYHTQLDAGGTLTFNHNLNHYVDTNQLRSGQAYLPVETGDNWELQIGLHSHLYVHWDDGERRELSTLAITNLGYAVSPDRSSVVFADDGLSLGLYILDFHTRTTTTLTIPDEVARPAVHNTPTAWTEDGIYFTVRHNNGAAGYFMRPDGSGLRRAVTLSPFHMTSTYQNEVADPAIGQDIVFPLVSLVGLLSLYSSDFI